MNRAGKLLEAATQPLNLILTGGPNPMPLNGTLSRLCRTYNEPKALPITGSQLTQKIACMSAAGLVIASMGFAAMYAWTTGIAYGWLMAALFVLFALALEGSKPLAVASAFAAFRSWAVFRGTALTLLAVVAIVYSI